MTEEVIAKREAERKRRFEICKALIQGVGCAGMFAALNFGAAKLGISLLPKKSTRLRAVTLSAASTPGKNVIPLCPGTLSVFATILGAGGGGHNVPVGDVETALVGCGGGSGAAGTASFADVPDMAGQQMIVYLGQGGKPGRDLLQPAGEGELSYLKFQNKQGKTVFHLQLGGGKGGTAELGGLAGTPQLLVGNPKIAFAPIQSGSAPGRNAINLGSGGALVSSSGTQAQTFTLVGPTGGSAQEGLIIPTALRGAGGSGGNRGTFGTTDLGTASSGGPAVAEILILYEQWDSVC